MINFLPQESKTLIVAHDWQEVLQRLQDVTATQVNEGGGPEKKLTGWVKDDRFQLVIRQRRLNAFMPMVEGRIDPTSTGCLIFLRYKLMPITRMYLILWTFIAILSGISLTIYYDTIFVSLATIGIIALIYGIAWGNFRIHQKPLHDIIFEILS